MSTLAARPLPGWYDLLGLNTWMFHAINGFHAPLYDRVMLLLSDLGSARTYPFWMAAILVLLWLRPKLVKLRDVLVFTLGYCLVQISLPLIKASFDIPRPFQTLPGNSNVLGAPSTDASFPSGHTIFAVLLAASFAPDLAPTGSAALWSFAALVAYSRVSLGHHFPADVVGGAIFALALTYALKFIVGRPNAPRL